MKKTKKIVFSRELHETVILRTQFTARAFCAVCATERDFLTLDSAVSLLGIGMRKISGGIEAGTIHALDAQNGQLLVCSKSLQH